MALKTTYVLCIGLFVVLGPLVLFSLSSSPEQVYFGNSSQLCFKDLIAGKRVCRPVCKQGYFAVPGMKYCHQWLTCEDFNTQITFGNMIANSPSKMVFQAYWQNYTFALNLAAGDMYISDFNHGKAMMVALLPHPHVIQLIGHCGTRYLTEYHPLTSANRLFLYLTSDKYKSYDTAELRYQLCLDYAHILNFLHNSPIGTRVMCDSNDLEKTLSQLLLRSDFRLILNDLDALPEVNYTKNQLIKCGHREIGGDFVAPEQLWPYSDKEFVDEEMPPYDEKSDIWKIPSVCNHFLDSSPHTISLKLHLFYIHSKCREDNPKLRPTAKEVIREYRKAWTLFKNENKHKTEL